MKIHMPFGDLRDFVLLTSVGQTVGTEMPKKADCSQREMRK